MASVRQGVRGGIVQPFMERYGWRDFVSHLCSSSIEVRETIFEFPSV